ncbi:hypothetical protein FOCC_FOCC008325 [Frankliniella occidentalis]|nr:hypothetical protein FOCC_FOCC008325 [Frankliniella occidentalis]
MGFDFRHGPSAAAATPGGGEDLSLWDSGKQLSAGRASRVRSKSVYWPGTTHMTCACPLYCSCGGADMVAELQVERA